MSKKSLLIVDDENTMREFLREVFLAERFTIFEAANGREAINIITGNHIDVVIMDLRMPGMDGIETLDELRKRKLDSKVIIMTGYGTIKTAVEAIKLGAFDYIVKPFENDEIVATVKEALSGTKSGAKHFDNRVTEYDEVRPAGIIGNSPVMNDIFKVIQKVASQNTTILITGESGTGKTMLAQAIHQLSERNQFPLITVNCAVLPENLLESELFGHEKGAFTGAIASRKGKFELAKNGTMFLDEISTLSLTTQAKLLRVIQDKRFERVGGERTIEVDVRIIAATNERLDKAVRDGYFREDLYYRLNVVTIEMPALRERHEDIPSLVSFFLRKFNEKLRKNITGVSDQAMDILVKYAWPGNVRELENIIERAMILSEYSEINVSCLPHHLVESAPNKNFSMVSSNLDKAVGNAEKDVIIKTLEQTDGHRGKAAEMLGISRRALQYKLKKYGMIND